MVSEELDKQALPFSADDVLVIIDYESGGDPTALNKKSGAYGLTQLMPVAVADYNQQNKTQLVHPDSFVNMPRLQIAVGIFTLARCYQFAALLLPKSERTPETMLTVALYCYSWGFGRVKESIQGLPRTFANIQAHANERARIYVAQIMKRLKAIKKEPFSEIAFFFPKRKAPIPA
jgi:hypothetical protein